MRVRLPFTTPIRRAKKDEEVNGGDLVWIANYIWGIADDCDGGQSKNWLDDASGKRNARAIFALTPMAQKASR